MENLVVRLSIQETVTGAGAAEKPAKTGLASPGTTLKLFSVAETVSSLKVVTVESKLVKFHIENLLLKSKPEAVGPADFDLAPGQGETLQVTTPDSTHEFRISIVEIIPKPAPAAPPKFKMPTHYFNPIQDLLKKLETGLSSKVVVYYTSAKGSITQEDPDYFSELLIGMPKLPKISLIIYSSGGDSMASLRIATLLRHYCDELDIVVPAKATSAATLLSLSADKIFFTPLGYLGPIDTQLAGITDERITKWSHSQISSDSFRRAKEMLEADNQKSSPDNPPRHPYSELFNHVHPLIVAEIDRVSSRSKRTAATMLKMHRQPFDEAKIESLANHLVYDYPSHGYPILYAEAKSLGLNAEMLPDPVSNTLWELLKYYRSVTRDQITDLNTEWYHVEHNQVVIEAVGKRLVRRYSFDKKLSPIEKKWQVSNDNSNWKKYLPPEKPGDPPRIVSVEIDDKPSAPAGPVTGNTPPADTSPTTPTSLPPENPA